VKLQIQPDTVSRELPLQGSAVQGDEVERQRRDNELIEKSIDGPKMNGAVDGRERLGGILNYYRRRAARW
jgi:hypothetical protein